jgi:hypothetical protein
MHAQVFDHALALWAVLLRHLPGGGWRGNQNWRTPMLTESYESFRPPTLPLRP